MLRSVSTRSIAVYAKQVIERVWTCFLAGIDSDERRDEMILLGVWGVPVAPVASFVLGRDPGRLIINQTRQLHYTMQRSAGFRT
jgi:hypothetical protein